MKTRGPGSRFLATAALAALASLLVLPAPALAEELEDGRVKGYVPPPTMLKKLGEGHWTPYDPPIPPEDQRVHVVVRGDTLGGVLGGGESLLRSPSALLGRG